MITSRYVDPLDLVWLHAARSAGIRVVRDAGVNASWDGSGTLRIGTAESLDADDCLAQMILHEMCHALVAGPAGDCLEDWGLDYDNPRHVVFEQATLRLQAAFATPYGLRAFLAATTDFRNFYDGLPELPLAASDDPATELARRGWELARQNGWLSILEQALEATRAIAHIVADRAGNDSLWQTARRAESTVGGSPCPECASHEPVI
jgi:hypothetical protein